MRSRNRFMLAYGQTRRGRKNRKLSRIMRRRNRWFREHHDELVELENSVAAAMDAAEQKTESADPAIREDGEKELKELDAFILHPVKTLLRMWREIQAQQENEEQELANNSEEEV